MKPHPYFILLLTSFFFLNCSSDTEDVTEIENLSAETSLDVSYGSNAQQVYDIYLPAGRNSTKTKVIILIHGGGWIEGDKADMAAYIFALQRNLPNHAIVNMNYVLADANNTAFPNQFLDVQKVINQLTEQANELQILPEFGLIGASAGAHIALMYDSVYDTNNKVKMVADIVGPSDFTDPFYADNPNFNFLIAALTDESAYPPNTNFAEVLSPVFNISSNTSPSLLFYGDADPLVPLSNGERLFTALINADIDHTFTVYEGGHGDNWSAENINNLTTQIIDYANTYLPIPVN